MLKCRLELARRVATSRHSSWAAVVQTRDSSISTETVRGRNICGHVAVWQSGKRICHDIGDTGHVDDVFGALSNEGQLSLLPGCPGFRNSVKSRRQRLVVSPQLELAALQSEPEVADGCEGRQQFSVKGRVLYLC